MKLETIKILEENTGSKILGISYSNISSNTAPLAKETKEKINKWDQIKKFLHSKETINKMKKTAH